MPNWIGIQRSTKNIADVLQTLALQKMKRQMDIEDLMQSELIKGNVQQALEKQAMRERLKMLGFGTEAPVRNIFGTGISQDMNRYILNPNYVLSGKGDILVESPEFKRKETAKELTADQKNAIQATKNSLTIMNDLEGKLSQKEKTGKYTYPTGFGGTLGIIPSLRYSTLPGAGTVMALRGKKGELSLNAQMRKLQAEFIKAQTGAQRGFKEMSFLLPALPMIDVQNNEQALEVLRSSKKDMINYLKQMEESSELELGSKKFENITPTETKSTYRVIRKMKR